MNNPDQHADIIVSGRFLMPTWRQADHIENGGVAVKGDTIVATGTRAELVEQFPAAVELHEPDGLVMPGLINTHTHAPMSCFRGIADDLPLMTWLEEHIFPAETKLNKDMVYQATLLSIAEMIRSGTTSFCDMYLFAGEVARAVEETGIRAWLGEVLYDFPSPSYGALNNGYALVRELFEQYRDHDLITITVDPHSVYTCAPALLEHCAALADEFNSRYVIHLSETDTEVATCRQRYGVSPVDHLHQLGLLNDRVLAAHCVKLSSKEIAVLARHRVKVSHCLESNLKLASGVAPVPEMLASGVTVSIGTDGPASNNDVDMFSEMSSVAKVHKVVATDPTVMDAETTLRCATLSGAEALGSEQQIGTLSAGKKADIIVLDLAQPHLTPIYNIASHLVYTARGGDVMHSLINGRLVMKNRELLSIDEQAVISAMQDIRHSVLANRA